MRSGKERSSAGQSCVVASTLNEAVPIQDEFSAGAPESWLHSGCMLIPSY